MQTPERPRSASAVAARIQAASPAQARPGNLQVAAGSLSPPRRAPAWQEVQNQVPSDRGLYATTTSGAARSSAVPTEPVATQVSYAIGTRPSAGQPGNPRMVLQADKAAPNPRDAVFDMLDRNHDGVITPAEWRQAMIGQAGQAASAAGLSQASAGPLGSGNLAGMRRNLDAQRGKLQALAGGGEAHPNSPGSPPERRAATQMQDLRKGFAALKQEQELQVAFVQDSVKEAEYTRTSLGGLAAERDRLQRQMHDQHREHEQQKLQTAELRATLADLQSESKRMQIEQRRQANMLTGTDGRGKAPAAIDAAAASQLARQAAAVDSVASAVASQDQKFAKLETDLHGLAASQRTQLAQALDQGRTLARALEEEGQRRSRSVLELQEMIATERQRENGVASKLQSELHSTTQAIQAQSGDWVNLARCIKSEVGSLAQELRTDREGRAIEASNQRHEITRMLDTARRANIEATVGAYDGAHLSDTGSDMLSRPGSVAVRKMVDSTKSLLFGLEEAIILRAGFLAGVFHTWRCEATLLKAGQRYQEEFLGMQDQWEAHLAGHTRCFEDELMRAAERHKTHKEKVRDKYALILAQKMMGEERTLAKEALHRWHEDARSHSSRQHNAGQIQKVLYQWMEGQVRGLVRSCWAAWKHQTIHDALDRKHRKEIEALQKAHEDQLGKVLSDAEAKVADGFALLESHHKRAKQDLEVVIAKWARGQTKGVMATVFQAFAANRTEGRQAKRNSEAAKVAVNKFLAGGAKGVKLSCWSAWKGEALHSKALLAEKTQLHDLLNNERAERERDEKARRNQEEQTKQAAKKGVQMAALKWATGQDKGCQKEILREWRLFCTTQAEGDRRTQSVHMQLAKWIEGENRGRVHSCFTTWSRESKISSTEKKAQAALEEESKKFKAFMEDKDKVYQASLQKHQTEAERLKAEALKAVESTIAKWHLCDAKGSMGAVFKEWSDLVRQTKQTAERHNAVKMALLRSMEGAARAIVQMAYTSWHQLIMTKKLERSQTDQVERERLHWEERQKQLMSEHEKAMQSAHGQLDDLRGQAHATTEMMLRRFLGGDDAGLKSAIFADWRRMQEMLKERRKKGVAAKDARCRFILGEQRGILLMALVSWRNLTKTESEHKNRVGALEKQLEKLMRHQEMRLAKYATTLSASSIPALKQLVLSNWREAASGVKKFEIMREKEVALAEMHRKQEMQATHKHLVQAKAVDAMSNKGSRALKMEVFLSWSYAWQLQRDTQATKLNHNKAMRALAEQTILKALKKDDKSLKTSCFAEWRREGKILRYEQAHAVAQHSHRTVEDQLQQSNLYASQLEQRVVSLEEQLQNTFSQVDMITVTLQKELQCKEELTRELREAYDKLRTNAFTPTSMGGFSGMMPRAGQEPISTAPALLLGTQDRASDLFSTMDRNHDGVITRAEWNRAMGDGGPPNGAAARPARSGRPSLNGSGSALLGTSSRASSPGRCDWANVIERMKEERLLRLGESAGV